MSTLINLSRRKFVQSLTVSTTVFGLYSREATAQSWATICGGFGAQAPPFLASYEPPSEHRYGFLAVVHTDERHSETVAVLEPAVQIIRPDVIVVEGLPESLGRNSEQAIDVARRALAAGDFPENLVAISIAVKNGIPFCGGDIAPEELAQLSLKRGFNQSDVIGSHLLRRGVDPVDESQREVVERVVKYVSRGQNHDFSYKAWVISKYHRLNVDSNLATPCSNGVAAEIVRYETKLRNEHLLALLTRLIDSKERFFVVFGANHWLALRDQLADRLGKPKLLRYPLNGST